MRKILSLFTLWAYYTTTRSLFGDAFCSLFRSSFFPPSVLGINELLFPCQVGYCDWIPRAIRSPSFSAAWRDVLIFVLSQRIVPWSRWSCVWNDNLSPLPCVTDAIIESLLHGEPWMLLLILCFWFLSIPILWAFKLAQCKLRSRDPEEAKCPVLPSIAYIYCPVSVCLSKPGQVSLGEETQLRADFTLSVSCFYILSSPALLPYPTEGSDAMLSLPYEGRVPICLISVFMVTLEPALGATQMWALSTEE